MVRTNLIKLADRINEQHQLCRKTMRMTLEHAVTAGELLENVKSEIGHGSFGQWITENCTFSFRTAQFYMQVSENRKQLKSEKFSHLSVSGAIKLLRQPKQKKQEKSDWRVQLAHTEENPFMPPGLREYYYTASHTETLLNRLIEKDIQPENLLKLITVRKHPTKPGFYQQARGYFEYYALVLFHQALMQAEEELFKEGLQALRDAGEETKIEIDEKTGTYIWTEAQLQILTKLHSPTR